MILFTLPSISVRAQFLKKLTPDEAVVQHAGSIGFFEAGVGYRLFKNQRGTLDFTYGYVPESKGGSLNILAAKFAYRPIEVDLGDKVKLFPVNPGMFISYHLGKDFDFTHDSEQFPNGYYWWSTAMRLHISVSNELQLNARKLLHTSFVKTVSLYTEFNTNELYLISLLQNTGAVAVKDIVKLGLGLRVRF